MHHRLRLRLAIVCAVALAGSVLGPSIASASAAPHAQPGTHAAAPGYPLNVFALKSMAPPGWCLDDSTQKGLRTFPCNLTSWKSGNQAWGFFNPVQGDSDIQLQNQATHNCLDFSQDFGLRTFPCNIPSYTNGFQAWRIIFQTRDGRAQFQVQAPPKGCLDSSQDFGLRTFPCNMPSFTNGFQAWFVGVIQPMGFVSR